MSKEAGSCERANKTACVIQLSDKILTTYRRQAALVYSAATKISRVLVRDLGALELGSPGKTGRWKQQRNHLLHS